MINGSLVLVRDNARAFRLSLVTCLVGFLMIVGALVIQQRSLSSFGFMVLIGLGLYLPYVAVHATIFERLLAVTRDRGNVGFLMYLADSTDTLAMLSACSPKVVCRQPPVFCPSSSVFAGLLRFCRLSASCLPGCTSREFGFAINRRRDPVVSAESLLLRSDDSRLRSFIRKCIQNVRGKFSCCRLQR